MPELRQVIRIFVGGPADTDPQREMLHRLIDGLKPAYKAFFDIEANSWNDGDTIPGIEARENAQDAIDAAIGPDTADIVFMLFKWSLGSAPHTKDGKRYVSSSVYELETALVNPSAAVYIYRTSAPLTMPEISPTATTDAFANWKLACQERTEMHRELEVYFKDYRRGGPASGASSPDRIFVSPFKNDDTLRKSLRNALSKELDRYRGLVQAGPRNDAAAQGPTALAAHASGDKDWPFRGIQPLDYRDSEIFFGRSDDKNTLLDRLTQKETRFICIEGASGTGKSSLLRAGLLPALINNGQEQGSDRWRLLLFKPADYGNPFLTLVAALAEEIAVPKPKAVAERLERACKAGIDEAEDEAARSIVGPCLDPYPSECELIVAIDQMEELWTSAAEQRAPFLTLIEGLISTPRVRVVATLRADLAPELAKNPTFVKLFNEFSASHKLAAPDAGQLETIIAGLCDKAGIQRGPGLVSAMLSDAKQAKEMPLPLVAHTLAAMQTHARSRQGTQTRLDFTLADYNAVGGINGAVAKGVEHAMQGKADKELLGQLFDRLVDMRSGNPVRVIAPRSQLEAAKLNSPLIDMLIEAPARVLVGGAGESGEGIQLAHDALFNAWPDLAEWVQRNRQDLELRDELQRDTEQWLRHGKRERWVRLKASAIEQVEALLEDNPGLFAGRQEILAYLDAARLGAAREKLIHSVKGGHIGAAAEEFRKIVRMLPERHGATIDVSGRFRAFEVPRALRRSILLTAHRGTEPDQLRPAFWAVVTGNDATDQVVNARRDQAGRQQASGSLFDSGEHIKATTSRGLTALSWAAAFGDLELVQKLIEKGADPRRLADDGSTLLHDAAYGGNLAVVRLLVEQHGIAPDAKNSDGTPPIMWAHQQGHWDVRRYLLEKGLTLKFAVKNEWNALTEAVRGFHLDEVTRLLETGEERVDCTVVDGITPLHVACQYDTSERSEVAGLLLKRGARADAETGSGDTPLHWAASFGHVSQANLLLRANANPNAINGGGDTPLHSAAWTRDRLPIVKALLDAGAEIDRRNDFGTTPLMAAAIVGHHRVARALLAAGADPSIVGEQDWGPLHYAAEDDDAAMLEFLVADPSRIDVNARSRDGWTALALAARNGHRRIVERLLQAGAIDVNARSRDGWTALALAARNGHRRIVERLLQAGARADLPIGNIDIDALYVADKYDHKDIVKCIADWGRDRPEMANSLKRQSERERKSVLSATGAQRSPQAQEREEPEIIVAALAGDRDGVQALLGQEGQLHAVGEGGRTALHAAALRGDTAIVDLLLSAGASAKATDEDDQTAADLADAAGHFTAARAIVEKGAPEPQAWSLPLVSETARFLGFEEALPGDRDRLADLIEAALEDAAAASSLYGPEPIPRDQLRIRTARLPVWQGGVLVAAEDLRRRGARERFVLTVEGEKPVVLNWGNEPIYQLCARAAPNLDGENATLFVRFFLHFVRGIVGRFLIIEDGGDIPWTAQASAEERAQAAQHVARMVLLPSPSPAERRLRATVLFRNALFRTDIRLLTGGRPGEARTGDAAGAGQGVDGTAVHPFELALVDETLLMENLNVRVDGPPGVYG